jgi:hypothetical protein
VAWSAIRGDLRSDAAAERFGVGGAPEVVEAARRGRLPGKLQTARVRDEAKHRLPREALPEVERGPSRRRALSCSGADWSRADVRPARSRHDVDSVGDLAPAMDHPAERADDDLPDRRGELRFLLEAREEPAHHR